MEGAAIAQTAYPQRHSLRHPPRHLRQGRRQREMDYPRLKKIAAHRCAEVTYPGCKAPARSGNDELICILRENYPGEIQHDGKTIWRSGGADGAKSPMWRDCPERFLDWRADLCGRADILNCYGAWGLEKQDAGTGVHDAGGVSALLTGLEGLSVYDDIAKARGSRYRVPITGFANGPSPPRPWSSRPKASFWAWVQKCSPSRGR